MTQFFELMIEQVLRELPKEFRDHLDNVAVVVEEWPSPEQLTQVQARPETLLFGLYQGVPKPKKGRYDLRLPDKITIFARPILLVSRDLEDLKQRIKSTLLHEIGHFFGLSETKLRQLEHQKHLV